jgi:hypothetical protein
VAATWGSVSSAASAAANSMMTTHKSLGTP